MLHGTSIIFRTMLWLHVYVFIYIILVTTYKIKVHDDMASIVVAQLLFLQSESSKKPIHMYINSPGGSVTAGLAIYDTMQYIMPPIATWYTIELRFNKIENIVSCMLIPSELLFRFAGALARLHQWVHYC